MSEVWPADVEDAQTSHHTGFMDRMLGHGHHGNEQEQMDQNEQHDQQPGVQPQQGAQANPPVKEGERERVKDYVDEERKLMQEGDTYAGLIKPFWYLYPYEAVVALLFPSWNYGQQNNAESDFAYDGGISKSSGVIYSTSNDLAKFATAIPNSRSYRQPTNVDGRNRLAHGGPAVFRRSTVGDKHAKFGGVPNLYIKLGDSENYGSFLVLVPDFDAGFSIIGASALPTRLRLKRGRIAGKYTTDRLNSSLALAFSSSVNPGLSVTSLVSNGTDLMPLLGILLGNENSRLVPTIVSEIAKQVAFRAYTATQQKSRGLFQKDFDVDDWLVVGDTRLDSWKSLYSKWMRRGRRARCNCQLGM
ncbi:hypothetical protein Aspvir_007050 [Aspergillus viridinutans]|uniref:Beta-lactamase-like ARB-00930-like C-terminal domain-containing protein n=1 Tax=Aspergillus viridinutans TaxID=75553 RepID=A0A9P3F2X0_ASPVI|nr:uncharacterized protein Aspvir_007050 [Aspergillus viridinutans]GIK02984.1 hypothetical protein Aspvir_007050 [Aspergillus viridinutans]